MKHNQTKQVTFSIRTYSYNYFTPIVFSVGFSLDSFLCEMAY